MTRQRIRRSRLFLSLRTTPHRHTTPQQTSRDTHTTTHWKTSTSNTHLRFVRVWTRRIPRGPVRRRSLCGGLLRRGEFCWSQWSRLVAIRVSTWRTATTRRIGHPMMYLVCERIIINTRYCMRHTNVKTDTQWCGVVCVCLDVGVT